MCDKTVDTCLPTLKSVPDWFVMNKIIENLDDMFWSDDVVFVNAYFYVTFLVMIWSY